MFKKPDCTPTGSCTVPRLHSWGACCFRCVECLCSLHWLFKRSLQREPGICIFWPWEQEGESGTGFLCYWSFMDLTLQATQPSLLCNWCVPWGISELPTSTLTDTWNSKHGLACPCLQCWMTWSRSSGQSSSPECWRVSMFSNTNGPAVSRSRVT